MYFKPNSVIFSITRTETFQQRKVLTDTLSQLPTETMPRNAKRLLSNIPKVFFLLELLGHCIIYTKLKKKKQNNTLEIVDICVGQCKWIKPPHLYICVKNGRLFIKAVWYTLFPSIFSLRNIGNAMSDQMLSWLFKF